MSILGLIRLITFGTVLVFSIIVMGTSAALIAWTNQKISGAYFKFSALALTTSLLTILTLPPMLIIDFLRSGAITSMVVFELGWLFTLWVLWLASAAYAANEMGLVGFSSNCGDFYFSTICSEFNVIEAFSFLNWIFLMAYTVVLLVHAIIAQSRGNTAWTTSVRNGHFLAPAAAGAGAGGVDATEKQAPPTEKTTSPPAPTTATSAAPAPATGVEQV